MIGSLVGSGRVGPGLRGHRHVGGRDAEVGFQRQAVLAVEAEFAVDQEVAGGKLHAVVDRLDKALDVVVEQLHELRGVGTAGGVEEDLLQLADDELLAEGWQHALGDDALRLPAGDGRLGVVRAELGRADAALAGTDPELHGVLAPLWHDRPGQLVVGGRGHGAGKGVEVGGVHAAEQGVEYEGDELLRRVGQTK